MFRSRILEEIYKVLNVVWNKCSCDVIMASSFTHLTRVNRRTTSNEECDTLYIHLQVHDTGVKAQKNLLPWLCPRRTYFLGSVQEDSLIDPMRFC